MSNYFFGIEQGNTRPKEKKKLPILQNTDTNKICFQVMMGNIVIVILFILQKNRQGIIKPMSVLQ